MHKIWLPTTVVVRSSHCVCVCVRRMTFKQNNLWPRYSSWPNPDEVCRSKLQVRAKVWRTLWSEAVLLLLLSDEWAQTTVVGATSTDSFSSQPMHMALYKFPLPHQPSSNSWCTKTRSYYQSISYKGQTVSFSWSCWAIMTGVWLADSQTWQSGQEKRHRTKSTEICMTAAGSQ